MLHIVCVKWGSKYSSEYANVLFDMVRRNLPAGFAGSFICYTDDPSGLDEGIETRTLPPGVEGWWNKLYLFAPGQFAEGDRVLFFDLDTVIVGKLDDIVTFDGWFGICRDFYRPNGLQSCVMSWRVSTITTRIWGHWCVKGRPILPGGDQAWIESLFEGDPEDGPIILQDAFPGAFVSYKAGNCAAAPPKRARVVCFHGEPKPHNCASEWVSRVWKVGGENAFDVELACNVSDERLFANIRANSSKDLPWLPLVEAHDGHAIMVGGGPSLADTLDEIRWRKSQGQVVFALNGAAKYLTENGIEVDHSIHLDARPENAQFVGWARHHFIASQCDPTVLAAARGREVTLFHPVIEGIADEVPLNGKPVHLVGGGTTVGLTSLALVYILGYRNLHLYGYDSSHRETEGHAFAQPMNDTDQIVSVTVADRTFRSSVVMAAQAEKFIDFATTLAQLDCTITVHGDGLLPFIAKQMQEPPSIAPEAVEITERDGLAWPSDDRHCHVAIPEMIQDLEDLIADCAERRVAVQAGGNVGVWPKRLAEVFGRVYTFEPDHNNFRCLVQNVTAPNVVKLQAALGDVPALVGLARESGNCGAHHVHGEGLIPTLRIDDLALDDCDLIALDIEGYELRALQGAVETLIKFRPVVMVEDKGLSEKYGTPEGAIEIWLADLGYRVKRRAHRDVIFTHQSETA